MKMTVLGVKRIEGTAKATGNPFDMCRVHCVVPIEVSSGKTRVSGYGFEQGEMELDPAALLKFEGLHFPLQLELQVEQRFVYGEFRSIVVGVVAASADVKPTVLQKQA